jgi:TolA-binding protein
MPQAAFNTATFVQKLVSLGISKEQAEAHVEVSFDMMKINFDNLATRADIERLESLIELRIADVRHALNLRIENVHYDLKDTESRLTHEIKETESRLNQKIESVESRLNQKIENVESRLTQKIESVEFRLKHEIKETKAELQYDIKQTNAKLDSKFTLLYWMFGSLLAGMAGLASLVFKALL